MKNHGANNYLFLAAFSLLLSFFGHSGASSATSLPYPIVDTGQEYCYGLSQAIPFPKSGDRFYGQDAQYNGPQPSYTDRGNGVIRDNVSGLQWTQVPKARRTYAEALAGAAACEVGGYSDWRLPSIKELYSLIQFNGSDPDPMSSGSSALTPFINSIFFQFSYGDPAQGERIIDAQYVSATRYVGRVMNGQESVFGVNFADGRIKSYPLQSPRGAKTFYVLYVRGNPNYGHNQFRDNGDGTISDEATGLTWMKSDSVQGMDWAGALAYAEELEWAGHSDWRLPNAKELQSIVEYSRSPDTSDSAAIDPLFDATEIINEAGEKDFAQYWTSTTHAGARSAQAGAYLAFGRSLGYMQNRRTGKGGWQDVHGAGSQRSDPKQGDSAQYPTGRGPQGDVIRIRNLVRCVRGGKVDTVLIGPKIIQQSTQDQERRRSPSKYTRRNQDSMQQGPGAEPFGARRGESQRGMGMRQGPGGRGPGGQGFVERLDQDDDGRVSKQEFDGPPDHFSHLDSNQDGYLSEEEAPMGPPPGVPQGR